jgi:hypothetical protein
MKSATTEDLRRSLTRFHDSATALQSLIDGQEPRRRLRLARRLPGWLPGWPATMLAVLVLGLAVYVAANAAAPPPVAKPEPAATRSLAAARLFALFPDGRVEVSDPWSGLRVFQWDGTKWRTLDPTDGTPASVEPRRKAAAAVSR